MKKYKNDALLILVFAVISLSVLLCISVFKKSGDYVKVTVDGKVEYFILTQNLEKKIVTGGNENLMVIENGKVYIKSASCPDKICVLHKPISKTGETIICLPNKVVLEITDEKD